MSYGSYSIKCLATGSPLENSRAICLVISQFRSVLFLSLCMTLLPLCVSFYLFAEKFLEAWLGIAPITISIESE